MAHDVLRCLQEFGIVTLPRDVVVYKKCCAENRWTPLIVRLLIPAGTKINYTPSKCRAEKALVLGAETMDNKTYDGPIMSFHDRTFEYKRFEWAKPRNGFGKSTAHCDGGIHFFRTRREARNFKY